MKITEDCFYLAKYMLPV